MEIDKKKYSRRIGIYRLYSTIDNRCYIGSSKDLFKRLTTHFNKLEQGKHSNKKLQSFYTDHPCNLEYEVLCFCKSHELNEKEDFYRNEYCSFENGFDLMAKSCRKSGNIVSKKKKDVLTKLKESNKVRREKITKEVN